MEKFLKWHWISQRANFIFALCSFVLLCGLSYEYYQIRHCLSEVMDLRLAYQARIQMLEELIVDKTSLDDTVNFCDNQKEIEDIFIPLNRNPSYLQACAYELFKKERIEELFRNGNQLAVPTNSALSNGVRKKSAKVHSSKRVVSDNGK